MRVRRSSWVAAWLLAGLGVGACAADDAGRSSAATQGAQESCRCRCNDMVAGTDQPPKPVVGPTLRVDRVQVRQLEILDAETGVPRVVLGDAGLTEEGNDAGITLLDREGRRRAVVGTTGAGWFTLVVYRGSVGQPALDLGVSPEGDVHFSVRGKTGTPSIKAKLTSRMGWLEILNKDGEEIVNESLE
jgi:hypothetical protein